MEKVQGNNANNQRLLNRNILNYKQNEQKTTDMRQTTGCQSRENIDKKTSQRMPPRQALSKLYMQQT